MPSTRLPWLALILSLACLLPLAGGETWQHALAFVRGHDGLGGALTAQFAHWGTWHALGNASVLLACGSYLEPRLGHARLAQFTVLACLFGAACVLWWATDLGEYRGASGLASGWLSMALIEFSRVRSRGGRFVLGWCAGLLFSLPAWLGVGSGVLPTGVRPVWELHLLAAVLAGLWHRMRVPASPLPPVGEGPGERAK